MAKLSIKEILDSIKEMNMLEVSELVQTLEKEFNITAAAPAAATVVQAPASGTEAADAAEEKTKFDVVLSDAGAQKIAVIKAVREIVPSLGLKEAKDLVDKAPQAVLEGASKEDADKAKVTLEKSGAKVEIK